MNPHLLFEFADEHGKVNQYPFSNPIEIYETNKIAEVGAIFERVEQAVKDGYYVAGYVSYEAAPAFHHSYQVTSNPNMPLVWFGLFKQIDSSLPMHASGTYHISKWENTFSYDEYHNGIDAIKRAIADGDTYQVNYTVRMQADFSGDEFRFYEQLTANQQAPYSAYLNLGNYRILSASPELFFRIKGSRIETKPMKGTAKRGRFSKEDQAMAVKLQQSEKERAENVMIVDLLRNDIGRIAQTGTVQVTSLFKTETYPTVHQMTSTITAELKEGTTVYDWFHALFPCGSITGAPKISTMDYIAALESSPRDVYCGAIGFITPEREAIFNVPIRTVVIDTEHEKATYGVGGGITWDSTTTGEYEETQVKARLLTERRQPFELLESLKLENGNYRLLTYHMNRLKSSAAYFGFSYYEEPIVATLEALAKQFHEGTYKARLLVSKDGTVKAEATLVQSIQEPITCALATTPVNAQNVFLFHKTTNRAMYKQFQQQAEQSFSVLLWNEQEELTEFTTGNLVVEQDGVYYTPPITSGLLAGTYRQALIDQGLLHEKVIFKIDLSSYDKIWFINSVRGWLEVQLDE